jgi:hypothetical protein
MRDDLDQKNRRLDATFVVVRDRCRPPSLGNCARCFEALEGGVGCDSVGCASEGCGSVGCGSVGRGGVLCVVAVCICGCGCLLCQHGCGSVCCGSELCIVVVCVVTV